METRHANNALDKYIAENDLERLFLIVNKNMKIAAGVAKKRYTKIRSKAKKTNCDTGLCVIFPCHQENGFADLMNCLNGCKVHNRCEGIVYVVVNYLEPETYISKKCTHGKGGNEWLEESLKEGIKMVLDENRDIMRRLTEIRIQIEKAENEDSKCVEREKNLKESMKQMKINPAIYHGGDLEGKIIKKMLDCAREESFKS